MKPIPELSEVENQVAILVLELISTWPEWVHRRVETLSFEDEKTVLRAVSVDFTLPEGLRSPLPQIDGHDTYAVPVALLRKAALRRFDLRDETGRSLPLMTSAENGVVAAGVLYNAAEVLPDDEDLAGLPRQLPAELRAELWRIANSDGTAGMKAWETLVHPAPDDSYVVGAWRRILGESQDFMSLTSDLARNFLVLTPIVTESAQRRIVKFSYEQTEEEVARIMRPVPRTSEASCPDIDTIEASSAAGVGLLRLRATTLRPESEGLVRVPLAMDVEIVGPDAVRYVARVGATERVLQVPVGMYTLEGRPPKGHVETSANRWDVDVKARSDRTLDFEHRPLKELVLAGDDPDPAPTRWHRLRVRAGWEAKNMVFFVPAIAQTQSHHVEFEAPDGLRITKAELVARPLYRQLGTADTETEHNEAEFHATERKSVQRSHLYVSRVPLGYSAIARFAVRPRPSTLVRSAWLSSVVTTVLLGIIWTALNDLGPNAGSAATILLLIPGGLSAYVARPREHLVATGMLLGVRLLALSQGFLAVVAALLIVVGRSWTIDSKTGSFRAGELHGWVGTGFAATIVCSGVVLGVLSISLWRASSPPEMRVSGDGSTVA